MNQENKQNNRSKKKVNRGWKLLILVAVLVIAVFVTLKVIEKNKPKKEQNTLTYGIGGETILTIDAKALDHLCWTYGADQFDFTYADGKWNCNIEPGYAPNANRMDIIVEKLADIKAGKVIQNPNALSEYGLDKPICTITAGDKVLKFGNISSLDSTYYFSIGDGKVYMVDSSYLTQFTFSRKEFVQFELIADMTDAIGVTVENQNGTFALEYLPDNDRTYSSYYTWFKQEESGLINQAVAQQLVKYLKNLDWLECVDTNADLAAYGLAEPAVRCTAVTFDETLRLCVGDQSVQGYYAALEGSKMVYLLDNATAEFLLSLSDQTLTCTDVLKMDWTTVTSVDVTMDGQTVTLAAGTDGKWFINGNEAAASDVLNCFELMSGSYDEAASVDGLTKELTLTINRNTRSFAQMTLTFYRYDGTNCVMQLDDNVPVLVPREDVVSIKEAFNTIILG